jgi:hypothetical protein
MSPLWIIVCIILAFLTGFSVAMLTTLDEKLRAVLQDEVEVIHSRLAAIEGGMKRDARWLVQEPAKIATEVKAEVKKVWP